MIKQALAHHMAGQLPQAKNLYKKILRVVPNHPEALHYLGVLNHQEGSSDNAINLITRALRYKSDYSSAYNSLGVIFNDLGRLEEAIASCNRALHLASGYAEAHYNLGNALIGQGRLEEATASYSQAITLKPDYAKAHNNLGKALREQGRLEEAVTCYNQAIRLKPDYFHAFSNLLYCLNFMSDITQEEIYSKSLKLGNIIEDITQKVFCIFENSTIKDRKLRIGYVSPDFRRHSVAYFIEPVLEAHNREKVETFCYANVKKDDDVTQRLKVKADHWVSILGMEDETVTTRILKDRIDILVDLAGHTKDNNLTVFARRPAPIQVTWLGFPNTTGLRSMDYRLTDTVADPEGEADKLHSEKLIRLKHGFLCYQPTDHSPEVDPSPFPANGYITFGSFNNLTKSTMSVLKTWARILHAVPDSRLLLKTRQLRDKGTRIRLKETFVKEGIAPERIDLHPVFVDQTEHLRLYGKVDIGLDPFPYNGTTTTCEALWMGVPVVALLGNRHAGRVSASILMRLGLQELIAASVEDYIELARTLAHDQKKLHDMRLNLRDRMKNSELMDKKLFTGHLEEIFQLLWHNYCKNKMLGTSNEM